MAVRFTPIPEALAFLAQGGTLVVMDDEDRENEGDLILAAEHATPERVAFVLRHTTGILCAPMTPERALDLQFPSMVAVNEDAKCTAFTVTCDAKRGITTGVSAADRASTFAQLAAPGARPADFTRPGHVFPLCAVPGGVLQRQGHTEASVDLCQLAGLQPVGLIGELMDHADGTMMRLPACAAFAEVHGLPLITIEALVAYRQLHMGPGPSPAAPPADSVFLAAECNLPIERRGQCLGMWRQLIFTNRASGHNHVVLVKGDVQHRPVLTRIHSECFTGDVLGSRRCDCGSQLDQAFRLIAQAGRGVVLYMGGHEGRGIGIVNKAKAYKLQMEEGYDTYEANEALGLPDDLRSYDDARDILQHLQVGEVELLTNNPMKVVELQGLAVPVHARPLRCAANEHNASYLTTKRAREQEMRRHLALPESPAQRLVGVAAEPALRKELPFVHTTVDATRAAALRVGMVRAAWNGEFVAQLRDGIRTALLAGGVRDENIIEQVVPGAYELPLAAQYLAKSGAVDAILVLAVLVQREAKDTVHFESAAQAVSQGIMQVQLSTSIPVLCGVLSCFTDDQVLDYIADPDDVPRALALSAIQMADMKRVSGPHEK